MNVEVEILFKDLHRNIKIRIYTSFLSRVVGSMVFPFMAIYFAKELNVVYAGILLLIQVIVQFIAGLYGGYLADSMGRKNDGYRGMDESAGICGHDFSQLTVVHFCMDYIFNAVGHEYLFWLH